MKEKAKSSKNFNKTVLVSPRQHCKSNFVKIFFHKGIKSYNVMFNIMRNNSTALDFPSDISNIANPTLNSLIF